MSMQTVMMKKEHLEQAIQKTTKMLARKGVPVTQRGAGAFVQFDAKTGEVIRINIPMIPNKPTQAFLDALQGFVDHECAHVFYTNPLEMQAAEIASPLKTAELHQFVNIVEDVRIEALIPKEFPGSEANLNHVRKHLIDTVWRPEFTALKKAADAGDDKAYRTLRGNAIIPYLRGLNGQTVCSEFIDEMGLASEFDGLHEVVPNLQSRLNSMLTGADAVKLAEEIMVACTPPTPPVPAEDEEPKSKSKSKDKKPPKDEEPSDDEEPSKGQSEPEKDEEPSKDEDEDEAEKNDDKDDKGEGSEGDEDEDAEEETKSDPEGDDGEGDEDEDGEESSGSDSSDDEPEDDEDADKDDGDKGSGDDASDDDEDADGSGDGSGDEDDGGEPSDDEGSETDEEGDSDDGIPGSGSDLGIDLSEAKDLDGMIEEAIKNMLNNAFDSKRQVDFTREYDLIAPYDDTGGREPNVRKVEDEVRTLTSAMQRDLQRIIVARSQCYMTPGHRRGRINPAALHRVPAGDDRVFRRKQEATSNKVAISLVIDNSGSMSGTKIETAMKAAWAFAETLERIKVPCDVVGFTDRRLDRDFDYDNFRKEIADMVDATGVSRHSIRTSPFYMPIYKGFDEKFGPRQKRRMAHLMEQQAILIANNDALAIEYAGRRLLARQETRKIMIVFSDGEPAGCVSGSVLNRTMADNIAALERNKVEIIGVGIQSESVRKFYKNAFVLNNVADLPLFVMKELRSLLAGGGRKA